MHTRSMMANLNTEIFFHIGSSSFKAFNRNFTSKPIVPKRKRYKSAPHALLKKTPILSLPQMLKINEMVQRNPIAPKNVLFDKISLRFIVSDQYRFSS